MKSWKSLLYSGVALGMLVYAVPRLGLGEGMNAQSVFGVVWLCFALLVISANLYRFLGVDAETQERLRQVKRMKQYRREEKMMPHKRRYGRA
ncbi:MAG: hypothetical protein K0R57_1936 [Paenibacillaceae bacterium]|jgi:hypothetical protein|nr:hypothetical protein [Paenibacillaceae bacterium]